MVACSIVLLLLIASVTSPVTRHPVTRHVASPTDLTPAQAAARPATRVPDLGVQFHGLWSHYDRAKRAAVLDRISQSGARWVRLDVSWAMIQPRRGSYDHRWGVPLVDEVLAQAKQRGLRVLVTFWLTPSWANKGKGERVAPDRASDYAKAIAWAARRWDDRVGAWEIWNEPNSTDFLRGADPRVYTRLLCAASSKLHRQDRKAKVVFGGLMYNDDAWLRRAYAVGARGCFDILGVHPYMAPADAAPGLPDNGKDWRMRHLGAVRRVMVQHRDKRPVWVTEFGWSSHRNSLGDAAWERGVSQRQQARYAVRALKVLGRDYPYVKKAFWYKDLAEKGSDRHQNGYAMLRGNLSPKPVFWALRRLVK
ncbi:hypothetical protein GCM10027020_03930 [Nocardioides salsibiostraticola]